MISNTDNNPPPPKRAGGVLKAGATVSVLTLLSRILGLIRDSLIATTFGAGHLTDAFFIALRIPNIFRRMIAEGSLATAAVPVLTRAGGSNTPAPFRRALGAVLAITVLCTAPLVLGGIFFSRELVLLISPGLGTEAELIEVARLLLVIIMPFLLTISLTAVLASGLNAVHRYGISTLPPIILNIAMIAALLSVGGVVENRIYILAWAFLFGSILGTVPLFLQLKSLNLAPELNLDLKHLKRFFPIFGPALLSSSAHQLLILILSLLASMLPIGSISTLYYADRIYQFPLGIFSLALATAALPRLAELRDYDKEFSRELTQLLTWVTFGVLPATVGLFTLASPIVRLIYEHGSFSTEHSTLTAEALQGYTLGLWPISLHVLLIRAYIARGYGRIPAISTIVAVAVTPIAALALMGPPTTEAGNALAQIIATLQGRMEIAQLKQFGLALSSGIGMIAAVIVLFLYLRKVHIFLDTKKLVLSTIKSSAGCVALWLFLVWIQNQITNLTALVLVAVPIGAMIYGLIIFLIARKQILQSDDNLG